MEVLLFTTNLRLQPNRAVHVASVLIKSAAEGGRSSLLFFLLLPALAGPTLIAPTPAHAQAQAPATSDLFDHGFASVGCFKFACGATDSLDYDGGIEYDRHNLGSHLSTFGHIMNYRAANPSASTRHENYSDRPSARTGTGRSMGQSPHHPEEDAGGRGPFTAGPAHDVARRQAGDALLGGKTGGVVFNEKARAPNATYANFTFQIGVGTQIKMTEKTNLRVGFQLFHFSNLYVNGSNPGLDTLGFTFGFVRHLPAGTNGKRGGLSSVVAAARGILLPNPGACPVNLALRAREI